MIALWILALGSFGGWALSLKVICGLSLRLHEFATRIEVTEQRLDLLPARRYARVP
jgi:hypothetical protein